MLKFYLSVRPIVQGRSLDEPSDHIRLGFIGLDIKCTNTWANRNLDGRYLLEFKIGSVESYTGQEESDYKAVLVEGLQKWGVHEKTAASAASLASDLTGVTWEVAQDGISIEPQE